MGKVKEGEEEIRKEVEKILRIIGVKDAVQGVRRIGGVGKGGRKGVEVKMKNKEVKRKVMEGKKELRGRRERMEEDLTWEERRVMLRIRRVAEEEKRKGGECECGIHGGFWEDRRKVEERQCQEWEEREKRGRGDIDGEGEDGGKKPEEGFKRGTVERGKKEIEVIFWNVAGLGNKEEDFWRRIKRGDVVCLVEMWIEEKSWERIRRKVPKGYNWWTQWAKKEGRKGRAKGGIVMGVRKEMKGRKRGEGGEEEGIMEIEVDIGGEEWRIVAVYVGDGIRGKENGIRRVMERDQGKRCLIGGDWNARTGEIAEWEENDEEEERKSRDKVVNAEERRMLNMLGEMGMGIINGRVQGDREGEFTYVGHMGRSVIDYVVGDRRTRLGIKRMEVEIRTESDHLPLIVSLKERRREVRRKEGVKATRGWGEGMREKYKKRMVEWKEERNEKIGERWKRMQEEIKKVVEEARREEKGREGRKKGLWDEECRESKKELRKMLRKWLREGCE
ncbi:golgin subfamily A member 6-like protein 25 [Prorops nasuta]|uniref:golgin subfamily A member 6-like protein 25 n=1 Tax=Prorops nasuta TaxID=863751 RepID=UPI0034CF3D56